MDGPLPRVRACTHVSLTTHIVARADKLGEPRAPPRDDVVGEDAPQVLLRLAARNREGQLPPRGEMGVGLDWDLIVSRRVVVYV